MSIENFFLDQEERWETLNQEEDLLDSKPFASNLLHIIESTPRTLSVSIGLTGEWGSGKTTILKFLKSFANEKHTVVYLRLWGRASVLSVLHELAQKLEESNTFKSEKKFNWDFFGVSTGAAASILNSEGVYYGRNLIATIDSIKSLVSKGAENKERLIILLDDLDRADPIVAPDLFYLLRNELNIGNTAFVVAYVPRVIKSNLALRNEAFGSTGDFLDKVFDFRFAVPEVNWSGVWHLVRRDFEGLTIPINLVNVADILNVLPRNPRKIRAFARQLFALKMIIDRFDDIELNQKLMVICCMIELLEPGLCDILSNVGLWERDGTLLSSQDSRVRINEIIENLQKNEIIKKENLHRINNLLIKLCELFPTWQEFQTYSHFLDRPPILTEKECLELQLRVRSSNMNVEEAIREFHQSTFVSLRVVLKAAFMKGIGIYNRILEKYRDVLINADAVPIEANHNLDYLQGIIKLGNQEGFEYSLDNDCFRELIRIHAQWGNWVGNSEWDALRERERALALSFITLPPFETEALFDPVAHWSSSYRQYQYAKETCDLVMQQLKRKLVAEIVDSFTYYAISSKISQHPNVYYDTILSVDSPLWDDTSIRVLKQDISLAPFLKGTMQENAYRLFLLFASPFDGYTITQGYYSRVKQFADRPDVLQLLLDGATVEELSSRMTGSLADARAVLEHELDIDLLAPDWLPKIKSPSLGSSSWQ